MRTLTPEQAAAVAQLPTYYTFRDVVELVFRGDHDACVDAWATRALPRAVRVTLEELVPADRQQVWLLQRILAVLTQPAGDPGQGQG